MYGIFICPRCGAVQGFEMRNRSASCGACGKRSDLSRTKRIGPFKDQKEMRKALWDLKAGDMEPSEIELKDELFESSPVERKRVLNKQGREDLVLEMVGRGNDTLDMLTTELASHDLNENEIVDIIESLQRKNLIYSPSHGCYRKV